MLERPSRAVLPALLALTLCCTAGGKSQQRAPAPEEATALLQAAEREASSSPLAAARAGFLRYLVASDPDGAQKRLAPLASSTDPAARALALCGLGEILEDRLDTLGAAQAWAAALAAAPREPLSELAALRLLDAEGDSGAVDDVVLAAAARTGAGAAPRAARFLREAAARVKARREPGSDAVAWRDAGAVQRWRVAGPYGAFRLFDLSRPLALDGPDRTRAPQTGSAGSAAERTLEVPDGDLGLESEPGEGDLFYAASEVTLQQGGDYLAWVEGASALEVRLDGLPVVVRSPYPRDPPRAQTAAVALPKGKHEVLVRWSRAEGNRFRLLLARADGAPSDLESAAPAELWGSRSAGSPCRLGQACLAKPAWRDASSLRAFAEQQLERDGGDPLAAWLLARATLGDDRATARAAAERAVVASNSGAPALALRAQQLLHDPEVPERISRARAIAELSEVSRKDPLFVRARLTVAALDRDSERYDDAALELDKAEAALRPLPPPPRLLVARARLLDSRGNAAGAKARAEEARKADGTRCDARQVLYEVARREGAIAAVDALAEELASCNEGLVALAGLRRERGDLAGAEELLTRLAAARPAQPGRLESLAEVQAARKEDARALDTLRRAAALAPRSSEPLRRLAGMQEALGDARAANATRAEALLRAPGDLSLRHQLALDRGEKLLSWADRDGLAIARAPLPPGIPPGAAAVRLLDLGAVQIFPDGGAVERVHTIDRVLDKKGIARFAEAQIPGDAEILALRTLKADGRILEPESIPEKEGISMPGVEAGDAIEIDYLRGMGKRGPELPGLTLGSFFFRDESTPLVESTYELRAPRDVEIDLDAHHLRAAPWSTQGSEQRWTLTLRDVLPLVPEPHQPGDNEIMPWVQVGMGAGVREQMLSTADWALLRARPSSATDELAARASGSTERERAASLFAAISEAVRGRSQGTDLATDAAHVLAQGRGNRLVVLKAALASAGIPSHVVLVRPFGADPAPYRFPHADLFGWAVLRIDLHDGALWADPSFRLAPLGSLPSFARGQEAWVLPEPGEQPQLIRTPDAARRDGRVIQLDLTLAADGAASGTGRDEHDGMEAAALKDALERMDKDQRKQAVEGMLGHGLRGVVLESLAVEGEAALGGSATLVYQLRAPLARDDGDKLAMPASPLPSRLARRWVQKAERTLPLVIDAPEQVALRTRIALQPGMKLAAQPAPVALQTPFGTYRWSAREEKGALFLDEALSMDKQRIEPAQYAAFATFARAVDAAQEQELTLQRPAR